MPVIDRWGKMQKINIGNSKLQATRVGLGCWQAGLKGWGEDYGDKDIIDAIKFYVENGGNYLDTEKYMEWVTRKNS